MGYGLSSVRARGMQCSYMKMQALKKYYINFH